MRAPLPCDRLEPHRRTLQRGTERSKDWFSAPIAYDRKRSGYYYTEPLSRPAMRLRGGAKPSRCFSPTSCWCNAGVSLSRRALTGPWPAPAHPGELPPGDRPPPKGVPDPRRLRSTSCRTALPLGASTHLQAPGAP